MRNLKKSLLNIALICISLIVFVIATPVGILFAIFFIGIVFSLFAMPLLSMPIILYFLGLVSVALLLKNIHLLPSFLQTKRPVWWIAHISLLSLSWWVCWEIISCEYFHLTPTENYLCAMIGVILGVVSVSLPIIIGNTSKSLVEYQNKLIAGIFKKEVAYKAMFVFVIPLLGFSLFSFFFFHNPDYTTDKAIEYTWENRIAAFILTSCIYSICVFIYFMLRFVEYAINTDEVILDRIGKAIEQQKLQKGFSSIYDEYAEVYAQILMKKGKEQSYVGLDKVFKQFSNYVTTIMNENKNNKYSNNNEGSMRYKRFLRNYSQSFFNIWKLVYVDNPTYTYYFSDEYEKIVKSGLENSDREVYESLLLIYQRIAFQITERDAEAIPVAGVIPWQWFFNIVRDNTFDVTKIHSIGIYLFLSMRTIIKMDNLVSFNLFISDIIDNIWNVFSIHYPSSAERNYVIVHKADVMYTLMEYHAILKECREIAPKGGLSGFVSKKFAINSISLIVAMTGAYCLFQKKYKFVHLIFEYNQPKDSNIQYFNQDISPDTIDVLLKWMNDYHIFRGAYFNLWDDHNDGGFWFEQYISLLLYRLYGKRDGKRLTVNCDGKSRQEIEADKINLNKIRDNIKTFSKEMIDECGFSGINRASVILKIDSMVNDLTEYQEEALKEQTLDSAKVDSLKEMVNKYIDKDNPWVNVFNTASSESDDPGMIKWCFTIFDKQLMEKSFFAEQNSVIYVGFPHTIAERIILKFAFQIERKLRIFAQLNPMDTNSRNYLTKTNLKEVIRELSGCIVVFINYFKVYDLLCPNDFCSGNDNGPMARIKGGPVVYSVRDRDNVASRLIVFRESDFTMINVQQIKGEVIDLNKKPEKVAELINKSPHWLSRIVSEDQERYLKQRVEIYFEYHFTLHAKVNPEIQLLSNI